ncbi:photosynthetic reaction center subunit H [Hoeflea sp. BAL378]|uniref:photosynthetic reaction center subunit H n=1 Tax=Hoeflea sp. BAL378 TaxID=1547437 RepID=UPI0005131B81|nr:photosynthetic reaction center subunit H [Hoeflea sp. BAL378]KGF68826.1 photosynthetic reaction center subunit H [Hoeflea sp. BAL378]
MQTGAITSYIDVAQVTLYAFWVFFAFLLFYIRQEDRREGYPLEADQSGYFNRDDWLFVPPAKTFLLPHGHGEVKVPNARRDNADRPVPGVKLANFSGAPYVPTGPNPMLDSIGPGSWAERSDTPDLRHEGGPKIVPLRVAPDFYIAEGEINPIGLRVVGFDLVVAGTITDIWVDQSEQMLRYLEVLTEVGVAPRTVLVPINFGTFRKIRDGSRIFYVNALLGEQFAHVPATKMPESITLLEEDRIMAYFGSGLLYAVPSRQEPLA